MKAIKEEAEIQEVTGLEEEVKDEKEVGGVQEEVKKVEEAVKKVLDVKDETLENDYQHPSFYVSLRVLWSADVGHSPLPACVINLSNYINFPKNFLLIQVNV